MHAVCMHAHAQVCVEVCTHACECDYIHVFLTESLLLFLRRGDVREALREHEPVARHRDLAALAAESVKHLDRAVQVAIVAHAPASDPL